MLQANIQGRILDAHVVFVVDASRDLKKNQETEINPQCEETETLNLTLALQITRYIMPSEEELMSRLDRSLLLSSS